MFDMLSRRVRKGNKALWKRMRVANENSDIEEELNDYDSIEEATLKHNKNHFNQAFGSLAFKDKLF